MQEYLMYGAVGGAILLITILAMKDSLFPYVPAGPLFTKAELNFYRYLTKAVGDKALVFGKVRIADVIQPKPSIKGSKRTTALNKIAQKHFDYVLVHPDTMEILAAIELNDSSHKQKDRVARDKLVRDAMKTCKIPFIEVPAGRSYDLGKLFSLLAPALDCIQPNNHVHERPILPINSNKDASHSNPISEAEPLPETTQVTPAIEEDVVSMEAAPISHDDAEPDSATSADIPQIFSRESIAEMEKEYAEGESPVTTCDMRVNN